MWHLRKIPKIAYFYWGNAQLPYLRYLSILSFRKWNPDWEVNLYLPSKLYAGALVNTSKDYKFTGKDYSSYLKGLNINIKTMNIPFIEEKCKDLEGACGSKQEVYKSDFLRWYLLSTIGGLWSDMDIMYFKSMENLAINKPENKKTNTVISLHPEYGHSVGFLLSSVNNEYYKYVLKKAKENFAPQHYQSIGVDLLFPFPSVYSIEKKFKTIKVKDIPIKTVYAYDVRNIKKIYNTNNMGRYGEDSIGLHWYAGHEMTTKYLNEIHHMNYNYCDNVLCKTIGKIYK